MLRQTAPGAATISADSRLMASINPGARYRTGIASRSRNSRNQMNQPGPSNQIPCLEIPQPEIEETELGAGQPVRGVIGDRHQDEDQRQIWQAEPQRAVAQKMADALALQAGPDEQAGQQEHQRHEEGVVEQRQHVEAGPALAVDDRRGRPRIVVWIKPPEDGVGDHRMVGQHQHGDEGAGTVERGVARGGFWHSAGRACAGKSVMDVMRAPASARSGAIVPPENRIQQGSYCFGQLRTAIKTPCSRCGNQFHGSRLTARYRGLAILRQATETEQ